MSEWREIVKAELREIISLIDEDPIYSANDVSDRIRSLNEFMEIQREELWGEDEIPTAADPEEEIAQPGAAPQAVVYQPFEEVCP